MPPEKDKKPPEDPENNPELPEQPEQPSQELTKEQIEDSTATEDQLEEVLRGRYITTTALSKRIGYNTRYISKLCAQGKIKAVKPLGNLWRIPEDEARRIINEGLPAPEKEVKKTTIELTPTEEQLKKIVTPKKEEPPAEIKQEERGTGPFDRFIKW